MVPATGTDRLAFPWVLWLAVIVHDARSCASATAWIRIYLAGIASHRPTLTLLRGGLKSFLVACYSRPSISLIIRNRVHRLHLRV